MNNSRMTEASPPFGAEHSLHVEVELCGAERPSSSLRGGADKYIAAFKQLRASLAELNFSCASYGIHSEVLEEMTSTRVQSSVE